jgi:hypothetical protein
VGGDGNDVTLTAVTGQSPVATSFYAVTPCRVADTRDPAGAYGAPPLAPYARRDFTVAGRCGLPADALGIAGNVTVVNPSAEGFLRVFPATAVIPIATTINFVTNRTRANNVVIGLGSGALAVENDAPGTVEFILDVVGYFR